MDTVLVEKTHYQLVQEGAPSAVIDYPALAPSELPGWCPLVGTLAVLAPSELHDQWFQVR